MFRYLNGEVTEVMLDQLVLDIGGVGYLLDVSHYTLAAVKVGMHVKLYIIEIIKEDEHVLCGFYDDHERKVFEHLISVSGIGRRVAMGMLSKAPYAKILEWLISGDEKQLTTLPGLGKKTAQRLIVELRDKLVKLYGASRESNLDLSTAYQSQKQVNEDVYLALSSLGFKRDEIAFMLKGVDLSAMTIEEAIKLALSSKRE
jgi:Holliday junction DNA helicase RuvA